MAHCPCLVPGHLSGYCAVRHTCASSLTKRAGPPTSAKSPSRATLSNSSPGPLPLCRPRVYPPSPRARLHNRFAYAAPTRMLLMGMWTGELPRFSTENQSLDAAHARNTRICTVGAGGRAREHTQLDDVADGAHGQEANGNGLRDLDELLLVGCKARVSASLLMQLALLLRLRLPRSRAGHRKRHVGLRTSGGGQTHASGTC